MKAVISAEHIKVFARAIHALAKLGSELYVESDEKGVSFRTANSSHSAFASFYFEEQFFCQFFPGESITDDETNCKVCMKSFLNAFRSLATVEKTIEKIKLSLDNPNARLVIQLSCKHSITRSYILSFIECESLNAVFDESQCTHRITSRSKFLNDVFLNFQSTQGEVCISTSHLSTALKNYVDDEPDPSKVIRTEMVLEKDEFDEYQIEGESEVVFCLKELRSLLAFTESFNLPITASFSQPNKPIIFCIDNRPLYQSRFVLATLIPSQITAVAPQDISSQNLNRTADQSQNNLEAGPDNRKKNPNTTELQECGPIARKRKRNESSKDCVPEPVEIDALYQSQDNQIINEFLVKEKPNPTTKRKRSNLFNRCFNSTFDPRMLSGAEIILAYDSDAE